MVHTKPDFVTADGREIDFDLTAISYREYSRTGDPEVLVSTKDETLAKAAGLTVDELVDLSVEDYKRLWQAFFVAARRPLELKNEDDPKKLSWRVYLAFNWGKPAPIELTYWTMAERFGWTLDYIKSLPLQDFIDFQLIEHARHREKPT